MFLNEATKLRAQTIIKGLEKRNMHGVFCATKEDALKQALSYIKEEMCIRDSHSSVHSFVLQK